MSTSTPPPVQLLPTLPAHPYRLDVPLHDLLKKPPASPTPAGAEKEFRISRPLPSPVFPQQPELLRELDAADITAHDTVLNTGKRHWPASKVLKTMEGWMLPYFKSRVLPGEFQPIIAYLFTEWKCNLDCHYCWSYDNRVKGMTEDTARRAIDGLHSTPCRVLAPTGGEPLLRPDFVHKVMYYAAKKISGYISLPTPGFCGPKSPTDLLTPALRLSTSPWTRLRKNRGFQRRSSTFARTSTISSGGNTVMAIPCFSTPTSAAPTSTTLKN